MSENTGNDQGDHLDEVFDALHDQVKREADLRIVGLMIEYRKLAQELLTDEEMEVWATNLGALLEDQELKLSPDVMQVYQKVDAEPAAREIFNRLFTLVQAKIKAREIESASKHTINALLKKSGYMSPEFPGTSQSSVSKSG